MTSAEKIPALSLPWRMKMALEDAGIGVAEMGERLGVSRDTISNWINGRIQPRRAFLRVWADECEVDFRWLAEGRIQTTARGLVEMLESVGAEDDLVFDVQLESLGSDKGLASITMLRPRRTVSGATPPSLDSELTVTYLKAA